MADEFEEQSEQHSENAENSENIEGTEGTDSGENTESVENIVLIGMPGSGKSTLGVLIARILGFEFLDADLLLQQRKSKTLEHIIDTLGPEGFLEVENEMLCNLKLEHTVLATGGSAVYSDEAMCHLRDMGCTVYLQIDFNEVSERLSSLPERSIVRRGGPDMSLRELYDERETLYERYADITVDVNGLTPTDAAHKIVDALEPVLARNAQ